LGTLPDALEDQRLRSLEHREVSSTTRRFCEVDARDGMSLAYGLARLSR